MENPTNTKAKHLNWAVESRYQNQQCALSLLELLTERQNKIKKRKFVMFAQALVGATFSLWRAAFLADKSGMKMESYKAAVSFLETMIADNAIGYAQDKREREWTFNYYVNNVHETLSRWHDEERFRLIVPAWTRLDRSPTERWEYAQKLLTDTVTNFATELQTPRALAQRPTPNP